MSNRSNNFSTVLGWTFDYFPYNFYDEKKRLVGKFVFGSDSLFQNYRISGIYNEPWKIIAQKLNVTFTMHKGWIDDIQL